ncbi:M48 family metallopeptidase [Pseudodesulfovibrio piezophilus]|uniref:Ste24 endopeptidase n=1 Tax=Pseudodesulfovibrio piezophilus (strain DSM 21447 / JCM 15486 / C1TLV30) TaxID=1322246 RepID=M1WV91_PSEP2|nr:M48 family metallopeptidase [Pseudodesulfovibrio piezophilus]CCH48253.1 Ste24 endopeptidase [Pseudodesulfovibrio piezophilus C1TLV30]
MNIYFIIILVSLIVSWVLGVLSNLLTLRHMESTLPPELADIYDAKTYAQSQDYARSTMRFSTVNDTVSTLLIIVFFVLGGFNWVDGLVRSCSLPPIIAGLTYIGLLGVGSFVVGLPFELYETFVLENRFGFNTTTVGTFILDRVKGGVLTVFLGGVLIAGVLYFIQQTGTWAWVWCWTLTTFLSLGLTYVAPTWILPLFNSFKPLEAGELRDALEHFAKTADFELTGIFVMDGSKRSTKGNAFFTGFGKRKRIALFDTLIKTQSPEEIVAVLAHEVGHAKRGHIRKGLLSSVLKTGVIFYLMSIFITSPGLFAAFGMEHMSLYAGLVFFFLLYAPLSLVLAVVSNLISRKHEFEADAFAAESTGNPASMISALKKLSANNLSNLTPHSLTVWLEYSHPPVLERVRALSRFMK